jgi:hypothetical protein
VLDLATLHWQKHTLWRMRQVAVLQDPFTADILQTDCHSWSGIRKRLRAAANDERTLLGALEAQGAKLLIENKMHALFRTVSDHVLPLQERLRQGPNAEQAFANAYAAESLEKLVRLEAALDARICEGFSAPRRVKRIQTHAGRRGAADGAFVSNRYLIAWSCIS